MTEIRQVTKADAPECGRIIYEAFAAIAGRHNFPPDFPSVDVATGVASMLIEHPGFHGVWAAISLISAPSSPASGRSPSIPQRRTGVPDAC